MLTRHPTRTTHSARGRHFAIVASRFNDRYVDRMLRAAQAVLKEAQAEKAQLVRVPGAYEIPIVAATLARTQTPPLSAIICLGVIFRGETTHAQHIAEAVSQALVQIQITFGIPVIHGVYLFENEAQAEVRCLGKEHNRGIDLANTALEMAEVMDRLRIGKRSS